MSDQPSELSALREATLKLTEQVVRLSDALQAVNALQVRQAEMDRKLTETLAVAEEQRGLANLLVDTLDEKQSKIASRRNLRLAFLASGLLIVTAIAITLNMNQQADVVRNQVDQNSFLIRQECQAAQSYIATGIVREQYLADHDLPVTRPAHRASADKFRQLRFSC